MRNLKYILILFLFVSCQQKTENKKVTSDLKTDSKEDKINTDTIDQTAQVTEKSSTSYLLNFLENPLDLQEFKKVNGPSNSGKINGEGLYKPDAIGFYLGFMLFTGNPDNQNSMVGLSEAQRFRKFQIYVYRYGNDVGDFFDSNETLIGFKCAFENKALGPANLVGKTKKEINELFGNDFIDLDSIQIYQNNNRALSLCFSSPTVKWMKYYQLSSPVLEDNIPERLMQFYDD